MPAVLGRAQIGGPVGLSWQAQPERHYLARPNLETAPALAPIKPAPPVGISGMAWLTSPDRDRPRTVIFDYPPSLGQLLNSVSVLPIIRTPVSGAWSIYQVTGRADPGTKP
jgi:hypothetical protein